MGKGGGCFPSKNRAPSGAPIPGELPSRLNQAAAEVRNQTETPASAAAAGATKKKVKIFIIFYSMYGHVESLALKMKKGVEEIEGVEGCLYRVAETLPAEVLEKMHAKPVDGVIPVISAAQLTEADGFLFGFPTRFGSMAAQMKAMFDTTGGLWAEQKLTGKPAGFFVSTGTQGGGQETTAWTAITQLAHHGMLYVPLGYSFGSALFDVNTLRGGSPYGAGTFAGDGSRLPTETELALAEHQGKYMAGVVKKLAQHSS